jgi:hypothetical protein
MILALATLSAALAAPPAAAADLGPGIEIHIEREIEASADAVWGLVAHEYADVGWSSMVVSSREMLEADLPKGIVADSAAPVIGRMVTTGFGEVSETLVAYDDTARAFTFRAGGLPGFIAYSQNTHTVTALDDGRSSLSFDIYVVPKGPMRLMKNRLKKRFAENISHHMDEAKAEVEGRAAGTPPLAQR